MRRWTAEEDEQLRRFLCGENIVARDAAHRMGITKNAVIGRARRLGIQWANSKGGGSKPKSPSGGRRVRIRRIASIVPLFTEKQVDDLSIPSSQRKANFIDLSDQRFGPERDKSSHTQFVMPGECRYPIDYPEGQFWCGQPQFAGKVYCAQHCGVCYVPPRQPRTDAPSLRVAA